MRSAVSNKRESRFSFVLEEIRPIRPTFRQMFGFTYVYLGERLLLSLRESAKQPRFNGVWLYTHTDHLESLRAEFPLLPKRCFWKSGRNGWVILPSELEDFEEYAFRACELILRGDQRVGRATRGSRRNG